MTKEEVVQEIKNGITTCMSLIDEENVDGCIDRMLNLCHKLMVNNQVTIKDDLFALTNKITAKFDVRVQKLNNLVDFIETTVSYTNGTCFGSADILENYVEHIVEIEELDAMDRCYIFSKIAKDNRISCEAGQIIAWGLFKSIEW